MSGRMGRRHLPDQHHFVKLSEKTTDTTLMNYAKTLPPALPNIFNRMRLFGFMDDLRNRQAIWVQGRPGAGKTSLVASYSKYCAIQTLWYRMDAGDNDPANFFHYFRLAVQNLPMIPDGLLPQLGPESLPNLPLFAGMYFRELFAGLEKPFFLIFDNLEEIAPDSPVNEIIAAALSEIPPGITAILISRNPPPPQLSRMQFNRTLSILDQRVFRLTDEEAYALSRLWLNGEIKTGAIGKMNELVDGWIAGLVLLLERGKDDALDVNIDQEYFFSYFASEIFETLKPEQQQLLLQTACLNAMTAAVARELTGIEQTQAILEDFSSRHYFISKSEQAEPEYQYHPLFRHFLIDQAQKKLSKNGYRLNSLKAAHILARVGQTEDAVALALAAADWTLASDLINSHAPVLLHQQRFVLLAQWLTELPQDVLNASPWLLYWMGDCRRPFNQQESTTFFTAAHAGFTKQKESLGMLLSASGALLSIITEWDDFQSLDPWIATLDTLVKKTKKFPSVEAEGMVVLAMLGALLFRMPLHPTIQKWEAHADRLFRDNTIDISLRMDIGNILVHWHYWRGDLAAASQTTEMISSLIANGCPATLPKLLSMMNHAIHAWHVANFDQALATVDQALELADETGIHILDDRLMAQSVYSSLSQDDLPTAKKILDRMKSILLDDRRLAVSHYHYLSCNYHLIAGDFEMARQHGQIALELNREVGAPFPEGVVCFSLAQAHFELGDAESAERLLARGRELTRRIKSRTLAILSEFTSAWCALQHDREEVMLSHLRRGLALQRRMGFLNFPGWRSSQMKPLLLKALQHDIEPRFIQRLVRKRALHSNAPPQESEKWPWPVKIYTLGRFTLLLDGEQRRFSGKAQQKPLELLKVLIALGGREISKDRLIDNLWPDTDGDKAHRTLDTTLHRFRKLVGYEQIILVHDRKLSLNAQLCWVDIWALERLLGHSKLYLTQPTLDTGKVTGLLQQLLSIYKDGFLTDDDTPECIIGYRARLQRRFLSRLTLIGRFWEQHLEWEKAADLYRRMLEMHELQEQIYQRLILCYRNMERIPEAIATYEQCRQVLLERYGIPTSAETKALYLSLR